MNKHSYSVERVEDINDGTQCYRIRGRRSVGEVWFTPTQDLMACSQCAGPLVAMKSNCRHTNAVRRFINRSQQEK